MQVIFLTNHADFYYAQKAIALRSFEYCLKPIEFDKLSLIIRKAAEKIEQENLRLELEKQTELLSIHQSKLLENHWMELLLGTVSDPLLPKTDTFILIFITCFPYYLEQKEIKSHFPCDSSISQQLHDLILNTICTEQGKLEAFLKYHKEKQQYAAILRLDHAGKPDVSSLASGCQTFLQELKHTFQCEASCCVSNMFSYRNAQETFHNLLNYHKNLKDCYGKIYFVQNASAVHTAPPDFPLSQIERCLETGNRKDCCLLFREYLSNASRSDCLTHEILSSFLVDITQLVFTFLKSREVLAHKLFQNPTYEFLLRHNTDSLANAEFYLNYLIENAFDYLNFTASQATVAETIKNYIDSNYYQDLTRNDLANIVYLHPDYVARIFKNEMNISLNNYMIQKRIEAAKKLLAETYLPVNTVSDKVGYGNYSYFSKLFRRETGMTPQEWRKENSI